MKFNPDLIQKARKGEIAILNDGTKDELQSVLMEVWNDLDGFSGKSKFFSRYCPGAKTWAAYDQTHLPAHSVKEFYMLNTKDNDQPRTYKVTRGQMEEIWEASNAENRPALIRLIEQWFTPFESEITIDYNQFFSILRCFNQKEPDVLKKHFPSYFYIPEGEPVLYQNERGGIVRIGISDGKGHVYLDNRTEGLPLTVHQIIPFIKNPPK